LEVAKTNQIPNQEINPNMNPVRSEPKCSPSPADRDLEDQKQILASFFKTLKCYFGNWKDLFVGIADQREVRKITYPLRVLMFTGVLLFVCQLGSRREINHKLRGNRAVQQKYKALFGIDEIPHGDTLAPPLANGAGRLRWKIENEGFNLQKNGGFGLEHAYSQNETAHKVFYLLLQMATILFQLMTKSPFFSKAFPKGVGSLKNIAFRFLEAWRNLRLGDLELICLLEVSLDSS
jgi:hypothetical protein